jgi:hypothetical protein
LVEEVAEARKEAGELWNHIRKYEENTKRYDLLKKYAACPAP